MEYLFFSDKEKENIPANFRKTLVTKGVYQTELGEPIRQELADRWTEILRMGLGDDAIRAFIKKYPTPKNFPRAVAPKLNREVATSLSYLSLKRDRIIAARQNVTGKIMSCLGQALTDVFNGNTSTKSLVAQISDAAKMAAAIYHQDSLTRQFFALAGATKTVRDAFKDAKPDEYLFGKDFMATLRAALKVQRTRTQNKTLSTVGKQQGTWINPMLQQRNRPLPQYQNMRQNPPRRFRSPHYYQYRQNYQRRFPPRAQYYY